MSRCWSEMALRLRRHANRLYLPRLQERVVAGRIARRVERLQIHLVVRADGVQYGREEAQLADLQRLDRAGLGQRIADAEGVAVAGEALCVSLVVGADDEELQRVRAI